MYHKWKQSCLLFGATLLVTVSAAAHAQMAPLSAPSLRTRAIVYTKPNISAETRQLYRRVARRVLNDPSVHGQIRITRNESANQSPPRNTEDPQAGAQIGASGATSTDGKGGGAGIVPSFTLRGPGDKYRFLFGFNTTPRQTVTNSSGGATSAASNNGFGSALLNPGAQTQSYNFLFFYKISDRTFKSTTAGNANGTDTPIDNPNAPANPPASPPVNPNTPVAPPGNADVPTEAIERAEINLAVSRGQELQTKTRGFKAILLRELSRELLDQPQEAHRGRRELSRKYTESSSSLNSENAPAEAYDLAESSLRTQLAEPQAGEPVNMDIVTGPQDITKFRFGVYARTNFGSLDFQGATSTTNTATQTVSGSVFAPALGFQALLGGGNPQGTNIQMGIEVGYTWRALLGDVAQNSNTAFRTANLLSSRTHFEGPEVTLFLHAGNSTLAYVRWTNMSGGNGLSGFSGGQLTIGVDVFTSLF